MKLLLYCTKAKPYLIGRKSAPYSYYLDKGGKYSIMDSRDFIHNGKIVAECDFEVEKFDFMSFLSYEDDVEKYNTEVRKLNEICKKSCLSATEMIFYLDTKALGTENPNGMIGYAIHIKNLHIFDKPKEIASYSSKQGYKIFKAPQNMQYAYEFTDKKGQQYVLISIRPQGLCKILNGEKTVEPRKIVLKEMLEND